MYVDGYPRYSIPLKFAQHCCLAVLSVAASDGENSVKCCCSFNPSLVAAAASCVNASEN